MQDDQILVVCDECAQFTIQPILSAAGLCCNQANSSATSPGVSPAQKFADHVNCILVSSHHFLSSVSGNNWSTPSLRKLKAVIQYSGTTGTTDWEIGGLASKNHIAICVTHGLQRSYEPSDVAAGNPSLKRQSACEEHDTNAQSGAFVTDDCRRSAAGEYSTKYCN